MYGFRSTLPLKLVAGAALLAVALPAQARTATPQADAQHAAEAQGASNKTAVTDKEQLRCRRYDDSTSRIKIFRACHTRNEWKRIERGDY